MNSECKLSVEEFIIKNTSPIIVNGLKELSQLNYPINDKHSFECAIDEKTKNLSYASFKVTDFPLVSAVGAYEKFVNRFLPFPIPFPLPDLRPELPADIVQTPSACEVYRREFPDPMAANCACRTYQAELRIGTHHLIATVRGVFAGQQYERTGVCPLDED